jgi:DNA-binding protein HU-beta
MTKSELLDDVAKQASMTKADTERVLEAFFAHVTASLKKGDSVAWPGFGKFDTTRRAARTVPNPQDRTKMVNVPASTALKFTPSSVLKAELNSTRK